MTNDFQLLVEGQTVNQKWEILSFIAKGGKGEVYLARQLGLERKVALKVMSKEFLDSLEGREEEYASELQRFRREVQVMASIRHQNVLQVFDFDQLQVNGQTLDYIVMEYIPGPTLRQTMPKQGFKQEEKAIVAWLQKYFFPVLQGMEAVHAKGVVHRDMKPENVLIDEQTPKIADFGLAGGYHLDGITRSFHIIGTPPYMPEEQFLDLISTDSRTDVYALGKILYEAIEGKMTQERNKPFQTVGLSSTSTWMLRRLDRVVRNATAKDRNARLPSVKALSQELSEVVEKSDYSARLPIFRKHRRQLILTGGIAGTVIFVLFLIFGLHLISMEPEEKSVAPESQTETVPSREFDFYFQDPRPTKKPEFPGGQSPPAQISGSDGMTLLLVPGRDREQSDAGDRERIQSEPALGSFYMGETKITNHLYVDFLRRVEGVRVEDGSVLRDGQVWLVLGEVVEGYEPIVYREGDFRIKPGTASNPVVRVTPTGARAYAKYYGLDLPTMSQWKRAIEDGMQDSGQVTENAQEPSQSHMQHMLDADTAQETEAKNTGNFIQSVAQSLPNALGLRGLGQNVNEWTLSVHKDGVEFHIHGETGDLGAQESYLKRQAWEAFQKVGFRTVLNLQTEER